MINTTILSLHIMSLALTSPLINVPNRHNSATQTLIKRSVFSNIFSSVFVSYTTKHASKFHETTFAKTLNTPLIFLSEDMNCAVNISQTYPGVVDHRTINAGSFGDWADKRAYYLENCGDVIIQFCIFDSCSNTKELYGGGSLVVEQYCTVFIYATQFKNSYTVKRKGAAIYAVQKSGLYENDKKEIIIDDTPLPEFTIQECCFSDCHNNEDDKLYGVAIYCCAENTILFMSSAVNCPGPTHNRAEGAQFDMQADIVKSKNVNITGGKSKYCAGIEYRNAKKGYFLYQTITNIEGCMFATAFTNINADGIEISYSNYNKIALEYNGGDNDVNLYPGLVHVRFKDIIIDTFVFTNLNVRSSKGAKIISRGTDWFNNTEGIWSNHEQDLKITVKNCYADNSVLDEYIPNRLLNNSRNPTVMFFGDIIREQNVATLEISQLLLGNCQGNFVPGDEIVKEELHEPSKTFTDSFKFTQSNEFSETVKFTESSLFSRSSLFSVSSSFSKSSYFSKSNGFSNSKAFSETNDFSKSSFFSKSLVFSESANFLQSSYFSGSADFSHSNSFSNSNAFSETDYFSKSTVFSQSKQFSNSMKFTNSDGFSQTVQFSETNDFSKSSLFSQSFNFTDSAYFSVSSQFTESADFTNTDGFSKSKQFSSSSVFSKTNVFSETNNFTKSDVFSLSFYKIKYFFRF